MDKTFELVICVDKEGKRKVVLEKSTIDKITSEFSIIENK